ncbi:MAG: sigma-70 family RNA polymerase sigma factor [bacterium]|nr:sigma-70 family RNA polymerase sigma factor [bacterium]
MLEKPIDPTNWVDDHGDVLYRFALLRVRDPHIAEDLVQETLISALEGLSRYKGGSSIQTWLVGILKHKIYDYFRKNAREISTAELSKLTDETEEEAVDRIQRSRGKGRQWGEDPHNLMENKEFWDVFTHCLDGLTPAFRQAFSLRELDGLKTDEICKILGITPTNLWVILHRARLRLRNCLDASWFGA